MKPFLNAARFAAKCLLALAVCSPLAGCWDLIELSDLAIVNMIGIDKDKRTGEMIVYYQIVNPSGIDGEKNNGINASVYTYDFQESSTAKFEEATTDIIPRRLFPDHFQAFVMSEESAKHDLIKIINYNEKQINRRSNVQVFISESPLSSVMNTFVPLERMPGKSIRSLIEVQASNYGRGSKHCELRDIIEHLDTPDPVLVPVIRLAGSEPSPDTKRLNRINGRIGNLSLDGGALIQRGSMVGRLNTRQVTQFLIYEGQTSCFLQTLKMETGDVDVKSTETEYRKRLTLSGGKPHLRLEIRGNLAVMYNNQKTGLDGANLKLVASRFDRQVEREGQQFFEEGKSRNLDLFGIQGQIWRKSGGEWTALKSNPDAWKTAEVDIIATSKVANVGNTIDPFSVE